MAASRREERGRNTVICLSSLKRYEFSQGWHLGNEYNYFPVFLLLSIAQYDAEFTKNAREVPSHLLRGSVGDRLLTPCGATGASSDHIELALLTAYVVGNSTCCFCVYLNSDDKGERGKVVVPISALTRGRLHVVCWGR